MFLSLLVPILCLTIGSYAESNVNYTVKYLGCYLKHFPGSKEILHEMLNPRLDLDDHISICADLGYHYVMIIKLSLTIGFICQENNRQQGLLLEDGKCHLCFNNSKWKCGENQTRVVYQIVTECGRYDKSADFLFAKDAEGVSNGVELLNYTSHTSNAIGQLNGSTITAIDYHYQLRKIFVAWNNTIHWFPLDSYYGNGSVQPESFITGLSDGCPTFTVDWLHNRIFSPLCSKYLYTILMVDLDGSNKDIFKQVDDPFYVKDIVVDPYKGLLFWSTSSNTVVSVGLDGRNLRTVDVGSAMEHGLALNMVAERVYFSLSSNSISYIQYKGWDVYSSSMTPLTHEIMSFDVLKSELYVISREQHGRMTYISKTYRNGFAECLVMVLHTSLPYLPMKLVHPEKQSPPKYDNCTVTACSHHCVVERFTARCRCPEEYILMDDQETCKRIQNQEREPIDMSIIAGIIGVIFIVFAAGVLMYLMDMLWSKIHPTVTALLPMSLNILYLS